METTLLDTSVKTQKTVSGKKVIDIFNSSIDVSTDYSLDELKKHLSNAFKTATKKSKRENTEKREPSQYNIFVKNEMHKLKEQYPDKPNKEIMSMAAALWKENKNNEVTEQITT